MVPFADFVKAEAHVAVRRVAAIKLPYQAKVTYQGRERLMLTAQTSGDCNSCHGQNATMMSPGRITVP